MATTADSELAKYISRFSPLDKVARKYHSRLLNHMNLQFFGKGSSIIRSFDHDSLAYFLVDGRVEIRESFDHRITLNAGEKSTRESLQSHLDHTGNTKVKATEDCQILTVDLQQLDSMLLAEQDYSINYLDEGGVSLDDDTLIDDNFQEDWENVFIRSSLTANLSNTMIHQLMSQLENITVSAGDSIVKENTPGDYFYLIKQGTAIVQTAVNGPFKGERFRLIAGNYFGDEALVADTTRNATVTMSTDGVLGRLNIDAFNNLIKCRLVEPLTRKILQESTEMKVIDVRFAAEFKRDHKKGADNIPISFLRQKLNQLSSTPLYVITPENDRRAELATYIMRQAGFQAFYGFEPLQTQP
ncbi:MAG: cyclic nucleotide-binding domain-containing protein [Oceanicoccus sp.]